MPKCLTRLEIRMTSAEAKSNAELVKAFYVCVCVGFLKPRFFLLFHTHQETMSDIAITRDGPAVDLSTHTMEDGAVVSTKERIYTSNVLPPHCPHKQSSMCNIACQR